MRRIGFGLSEKTVNGKSYLYVWYYKNAQKVWRFAGKDRTAALKMLRRFAQESKRGAIAYIDTRLGEYEKKLG